MCYLFAGLAMPATVVSRRPRRPVYIIEKITPLLGLVYSRRPIFAFGSRGQSFPIVLVKAESGQSPTGRREIRAS